MVSVASIAFQAIENLLIFISVIFKYWILFTFKYCSSNELIRNILKHPPYHVYYFFKTCLLGGLRAIFILLLFLHGAIFRLPLPRGCPRFWERTIALRRIPLRRNLQPTPTNTSQHRSVTASCMIHTAYCNIYFMYVPIYSLPRKCRNLIKWDFFSCGNTNFRSNLLK